MTGLLSGLAVGLIALWVTAPAWWGEWDYWAPLCQVLPHRWRYRWTAYAVLQRCTRCGATR